MRLIYYTFLKKKERKKKVYYTFSHVKMSVTKHEAH